MIRIQRIHKTINSVHWTWHGWPQRTEQSNLSVPL